MNGHSDNPVSLTPSNCPPAAGDGCLTGTMFEQAADLGQLAAPLADHLASCQACQKRLEAAQSDETFLKRARSLKGNDLPPLGGPRIPGYRTLSVISSGSQGVVYKGVQESTSRMVAIKALSAGHTSTPRQRARAEREAEIAASLRHPSIVTVFESRTLADGRIVVVMEFIDGVPIDQWKPPGATPAERKRELLRVFIEMCAGVHHSHLSGVIHRDLKPDNILVTPGGRPVVLDFGIAKAGNIRTTMTGEFAGTPAFASPEQVSGQPDLVNALTDVYSLGVILYRLVCGVLPYDVQGSIFDIARTISEVEPTPPTQHDPNISHDLQAIVLKALRKHQPIRYQSAAALAADLTNYLSGNPVSARSGSGWYLLRKAVAVNRNRLIAAGVGVALVLLAGAAVAVSFSRASESDRRAADQREAARLESVRARAVTELLRETLPNADPARPELAGIISHGLGRLYVRLETNAFSEQADVDQALRRLWGSVYTGFGGGKAAGLVEFAELALRNGLMRLRREQGRKAGGADTAAEQQRQVDIASTMHELAGVLLIRRRLPEAEVMCRDAMALRQTVTGPGSLTAAESRVLLTRILLARGETVRAMAEADAATNLLRKLPGPSSDAILASMIAVKARVALDHARGEEAEPLVREAFVRRLSTLPTEDPELLESVGQLAELAEMMPSCKTVQELTVAIGPSNESLAVVLRADLPPLRSANRTVYPNAVRSRRPAALARLARMQMALLGPDDLSLVGTLMAHVAASEREGMVGAATAEISLQAAAILSKRYGPTDPSLLFCIDRASAAYAFLGPASRAVELGRQACAIFDAIPPDSRDYLLAANTKRWFAWYLALDGKYEESRQAHEAAIAELETVVGARHHVVAIAQSGLAFCLWHLGREAEADAVSAAAIKLAKDSPALPYDQLAHICFVRGHILCAQHRDAEAEPLMLKSWEIVFRCAGQGFVWRQIMIKDMIALELRRGSVAAAVTWRSYDSEDCIQDAPR